MKRKKFLLEEKIFFLFFIFLILQYQLVFSQEISSKLVSTDWLQGNLAKENLRIIDLRSDIRDYWTSHISGAVYFNSEAMRLADGGVPGMLAPPKILAMMLGKMGITEKTTIIIYSEGGDSKAPYLIWALDYVGHKNSAILEGGFGKWQKENRATTQDYPKIKPTEYNLSYQLHPEVRARLEEVKEVVNKGGAVLLDVRPSELYDGEKGTWKRKGHIKGAINHFWAEDLKEDGTWKEKKELEKIYQELGVTREKNIIVSCGQGLMSAHAFFTLKYILGFPKVKNYDGSFNEWSNIDELPVETGK
jgi:thiosulfate/3-mercaptopyruvate sulfurtransferase